MNVHEIVTSRDNTGIQTIETFHYEDSQIVLKVCL